MNATKIGCVVDVQEDFMRRTGRLYVHHLADPDDVGAQSVIPAIRQANAYLQETTNLVIYTADWHRDDDPEIDALAPDPVAGTYPPHCMGASEQTSLRAGAALIAELGDSLMDDLLVLSRDATPPEARALARKALAEGISVLVQKKVFSVWDGNPAFEAFVSELASVLGTNIDFRTLGVATDVCVTQFVDGALSRGYQVTALVDAMYGLGLEDDAAVHARWQAAGAVLTTIPRQVSPPPRR